MDTVAVTGATGFIGSAVVRHLLAAGRKVRALIEPGASTRNLDPLNVPEIEWVTVDVCDARGMERALQGISTLYHLAAIYKIWLPDPALIYRVNIEGTTTTLLAAQRAGVRKVVYTSSIATIGLREDGKPADETTEFNVFGLANDYILTKYLSERIALRFAEAGLPLVVVNPGFPFGAGDIGPTPTGRIILSLLEGNIPGYSAGGFCAIDVEDVAAGHLLAEEKGRVGERYILANHNITWRDFFRQVCEIAGVKPPRWRVPVALTAALSWGMEQVANHITHKEPYVTYKSSLYASKNFFYDNTKARTELGLPVTPLAESIERAVRFFREEGVGKRG